MSFQTIPTMDAASGVWGHRVFETREELLAYVWTLFKEPGKYEFDETTKEWNRQAQQWNKYGFYCQAPKMSKDFLDYWDAQKDRCRNGVIFIGKTGTEWYLPRDYYMWVNFLPLALKEGGFGFPSLWDTQYHMALYEVLAKLSRKHCAILKKRQIASSYFHSAKMINYYWFEQGWVNKMAASLKDYINEKGTWRFLEQQRNFLNKYTAWFRPSTPDKVLNWEQKIETTGEGGRKEDVGNMSTIMGLVLDKDATNGVGGLCSLFWHEEGGIAKNMGKTWEFLMPALKAGLEYTGQAIASGSVGELDQCEPLKELILRPESGDVLAVPTDLLDEKGTKGMCGLFIPEQWSMPPCIDEWGNSLVEEALAAIVLDRIEVKKVKAPDKYQLYVSQHPINIKEAFASRSTSVWPLHLVAAQIERLENKEYFLEYLDIERNDQTLKPQWKKTNRIPISEFPLPPTTVDKQGVIVVHEKPIPGSAWGTYVGTIDPVRDGKTKTSDSLCSIEIYKNDVEVTTELPDGSIKVELEPGKMVAFWTGRFDDVKDTHERLSLLLEIYQAQAVIEVNVAEFVTFMITNNRQKYMVRKDQLLFLKELNTNQTTYQEYGWKNTGTTFVVSMIPYGVSMMTEELDRETDEHGETVSVRYGVERIMDIMLLKEMQAYRLGLNVDRIVAWSALCTYVKIQRAARSSAFQRKQVQKEKVQNLQNSPKNTKLIEGRTPFRHMGQGFGAKRPGPTLPVRSAFRNLR